MRRFQQKALAPEPDENGGVTLETGQQQALAGQLEAVGAGLQPLPRKRRPQLSTTDPDARFLRARDGWVLGYTGDLAVSEDHFIVAARVTQSAADNGSFVPMLDEVERETQARPEKASGDAGFFSHEALETCRERGIDAYLPDNNLTHEMNTGKDAQDRIGANTIRDPEHLRMRAKLRTSAGRDIYRTRQAMVEPLFGIFKEQRGMRRFRRRGLEAVNMEWKLLATAHNLRRMAR